jgi:AAA domain
MRPHIDDLADGFPDNGVAEIPKRITGDGERPAARNGQTGPKPKFILERYEEIQFSPKDEFLIKGVLPKVGVACIYGASQSFKSFSALDIGLRSAAGWEWAGKKIEKTSVIYVAAEGAAGIRKRVAGFARVHPEFPASEFYLVSVAPNLGSAKGDLEVLISDIAAVAGNPGLIIIDVLSQTLGSADENNVGMVQFTGNAQALSKHFGCLVLAIHHVGHPDGQDGKSQRLRGHSSFGNSLDASILAERIEGTLETTLTIMKLKDEESGVRYRARLRRIVIRHDTDCDEVSTLIVDEVIAADGDSKPKPKAKGRVPAGQQLLLDTISLALVENGKQLKPLADGPLVDAVPESALRSRYYARLAERAEPGEDSAKLAERQRKAFGRAVTEAVKAMRVYASDANGERMLWL